MLEINIINRNILLTIVESCFVFRIKQQVLGDLGWPNVECLEAGGGRTFDNNGRNVVFATKDLIHHHLAVSTLRVIKIDHYRAFRGK